MRAANLLYPSSASAELFIARNLDIKKPALWPVAFTCYLYPSHLSLATS
jgi:hypothetical protein